MIVKNEVRFIGFLMSMFIFVALFSCIGLDSFVPSYYWETKDIFVRDRIAGPALISLVGVIVMIVANWKGATK